MEKGPEQLRVRPLGILDWTYADGRAMVTPTEQEVDKRLYFADERNCLIYLAKLSWD